MVRASQKLAQEHMQEVLTPLKNLAIIVVTVGPLSSRISDITVVILKKTEYYTK